MTNIPQQTVFPPEIFSKPVSVSFSKEHLSSNGGSVLLKAVDKKLDLTEAIAGAIVDKRQPEKVRHEILDLVRQRVFGLASGYPDCNDSQHLRRDPIMKLLCDRDPISGADLASQPTLSRLENSVTQRQLMSMAERLSETVLRRQAQRRPGEYRQRVIIDIDPTCDPTYGQQQLTFFNGYYDTFCYLPLVVTISFGRERRKYPLALVLRPGVIHGKNGKGTLPILKRVLRSIRRYFPNSPIYFRADAEFAAPWLMDWLEESRVKYAISKSSNSVLKHCSARTMAISRARARKFNRSETWHRETLYQAGSWKQPRRVAYKAEVLLKDGEFRDNERYIVTNLKDNYGPQGVFNFYYGHSVIENTIKDFKYDLALGRTSCSSFLANQLRVTWSLAAFILMQSLQEHIVDRRLASATMHTLRECLLKIAVVVRESTRRIVANFTAHHPWADIWLKCALNMGAASG